MDTYKIVGNEYTSPYFDFDADLFAQEMIAKCAEMDFPWQQIRMDEDGRVYAYSTPAQMRERSWSHTTSIGTSQHLTSIDGNEVSWQDFGIIRKMEADSMATLKYTQAGQDFDIVGADDYTGNQFGDTLSMLVFELIDTANKKLPNWTEIRMDKEFGVAAYTESPRTEYGCWVCDTNEFAPLDYFESNRGLNWQDFGIIRKTEAENMNYKIVGTDGYKPHPSHMENIAAGLVADAKARCEDWKEIRIDSNGFVFAYDTLPYRYKRFWDFVDEDGEMFGLTDLSTELEVGLNWQTFGIIRTEEAEEDEPELIRLPDILWQAHFEQPHTTLTPELITALSDWPDSALETIAQAIADGRIVLQ